MLYRFKDSQPLENLQPVISGEDLMALFPAVRAVRIGEPVAHYLLNIIRATREYPTMRLGASPRAAIWLIRSSQAHAVLSGRDYVVPGDVKVLAVACLAHRLVTEGGMHQAASTVRDLIETIPSPRP